MIRNGNGSIRDLDDGIDGAHWPAPLGAVACFRANSGSRADGRDD
jgi:hypothetical protein